MELKMPGGQTFIPDMIFYHTRLKSYIVCELKVVPFIPDFAGKLNIVDLEHTDPDILYKILQTPIRKGAHITEFAVLNLSLLFALSFWDMKGVKWVRTAFLLTVLYACTDEFHQIFVPGRAGLIRDVLIDSIGPTVIMGSYVLVRLLKMGKKHI